MRNFSVVSYFCGCGGLDLGVRGDFSFLGKKYKRLPFDVLAAYDVNPDAVDTYNHYFKEKATVADLTQLDPAKVADADLLTGGFPCQDFSSCGPLRGLNSERGQLYKVMIRYMEAHKPKVVIGENVVNLGRMENGKIIEKITSDLKATGYKVVVWKMFAPDYGIPQMRTRLFFICVREDLPGFPEQPQPMFTRENYRGIEDAIGDLENVTDDSVPNQNQFFRASRAKRGNGQGDERNIMGKPAYTIRANPKSRVQFHYRLNRRLTVRECARLQTFPDNFIFPHSMTKSMQEIGNAVPPVMGYIIAKAIAGYMESLRGEL